MGLWIYWREHMLKCFAILTYNHVNLQHGVSCWAGLGFPVTEYFLFCLLNLTCWIAEWLGLVIL